MRKQTLIGVLALLASGCGTDEPVNSSDGWEHVLLARAVDLDPAADVVEIELAAAFAEKRYPGAETSQVYSYNGTVPGPLIEAKVGDRVIVHFENQLPEPTTIHWHGVRLPAAMDGTLAMQDPIEPGASFEYAYTLKDAGLFWFHPHVRSDVQVEKGLYGTLLVRGENEPEVDREAVIVLDDVRVLDDGTFPEYLDDESKMMGREGNVLLFNGQSQPRLPVRAGSVLRLRLVNTANGRFFNLAVAGHVFRVIGTDGGLVPVPYDTERVLMAPGERYDVLLVPQGDAGSELVLMNEPYARGHDSGGEEPMPVATFVIDDQPAAPARALPDSFPAIERLPSGPVDFPIVLNEGVDAQGELVFTINGAAYPNVPMLSVPNGTTRVLRVENDSDMDHPFHLHGFFFQTLAVDGQPPPESALVNKDTQIIRAHSGIDLVARFDEPGSWMYHCHILEHAEGGMAGEIMVE